MEIKEEAISTVNHTMTGQQVLESDLLDILFEQRNKLYGAYLLRRTYPQQLIKALCIAVGSAFLLLFFFQPAPAETVTIKADDGVIVREFHEMPKEQKKPEPPKPLQAPQANRVKQQLFTNNIQMTEKELQNPLPPQDAFDRAAVSAQTSNGVDDAPSLQSPVAAEAGPIGNGETGAKEKPQMEIVPDKQPQFPGGMQAWLSFLNRNLQSPDELENGEKRTVLIRFYVAEDGSVTNFQVVKSAGSAFDNEVVRVLKKMPKWTPAQQAGRPVPVSFTQPVTFVGLEE